MEEKQRYQVIFAFEHGIKVDIITESTRNEVAEILIKGDPIVLTGVTETGMPLELTIEYPDKLLAWVHTIHGRIVGGQFGIHR